VTLTAGYPPSVQTIGYFVPVEQWQSYQNGQHKGFSPYLIAQKGRTLSPEEFEDFKRYVHSRQGELAARQIHTFFTRERLQLSQTQGFRMCRW
jgi:hypothetical protein